MRERRRALGFRVAATASWSIAVTVAAWFGAQPSSARAFAVEPPTACAIEDACTDVTCPGPSHCCSPDCERQPDGSLVCDPCPVGGGEICDNGIDDDEDGLADCDDLPDCCGSCGPENLCEEGVCGAHPECGFYCGCESDEECVVPPADDPPTDEPEAPAEGFAGRCEPAECNMGPTPPDADSTNWSINIDSSRMNGSWSRRLNAIQRNLGHLLRGRGRPGGPSGIGGGNTDALRFWLHAHSHSESSGDIFCNVESNSDLEGAFGVDLFTDGVEGQIVGDFDSRARHCRECLSPPIWECTDFACRWENATVDGNAAYRRSWSFPFRLPRWAGPLAGRGVSVNVTGRLGAGGGYSEQKRIGNAGAACFATSGCESCLTQTANINAVFGLSGHGALDIAIGSVSLTVWGEVRIGYRFNWNQPDEHCAGGLEGDSMRISARACYRASVSLTTPWINLGGSWDFNDCASI